MQSRSRLSRSPKRSRQARRSTAISLFGTGLDTVEHLLWDDSLGNEGEIGLEHCAMSDDGTEMSVNAAAIAGIVPDPTPEGLKFGFTVKSHGGVPSSPEQADRLGDILVYDKA